MTTTNNITGDKLQSKPQSDAYKKGYDAIDWTALQKTVEESKKKVATDK